MRSCGRGVLWQAGYEEHTSEFGSVVTPRTVAHQASLSITNSRSLLRLMSIKSVMLSNHLILCHSLLLLPSIFPSIRVFSNESLLCIRWPSIGASVLASVLPMNSQAWFPLRLIGLISLQSKGLSKSSPNTLKALWHAQIKENVWKESNLSSKKYFIMYIKKYYARYLRNS